MVFVDLLSVLGPPLAIVSAGQLAASIKSATIGPALENKIKKLCEPISQRVGEWRDEDPSGIPDGTNHDLRRALAKSFVSCAVAWGKELEGDADLPELRAFCTRVKGYVSSLDQKASKRAEEFTEEISTDRLFTELLDVVPLSGADLTDLQIVSKKLCGNFEAFVRGKEAQDLPDQAKLLLEKTLKPNGFEGSCNAFGYQVIEKFLECLKSGGYPQATVAFEIRILGELRNDLHQVQDEILALAQGSSDDRQQIQVNMDRTLLELARIGEISCRIEMQLDRQGKVVRQTNRTVETIESQQKGLDVLVRQLRQNLGQLNLDRKVTKGQGSDDFVKMRFDSRGTKFLGRDEALAELHDFLDDGAPFLWWQVDGEGGQGKSRVALELIDQLGADWQGGFLGSSELRSGVSWNLVHFDFHTLVVIDYLSAPDKVASFADVIQQLETRFQLRSGEPLLTHKLRILILDRTGYHLNRQNSSFASSWLGRMRENVFTILENTAYRPEPHKLGNLPHETMVAIGNSWRMELENEANRAPMSKEEETKLLTLMGGGPPESGERNKAWRPLFAMLIAEHLSSFEAGGAGSEPTIEFILEMALKAERDSYWLKDETAIELRDAALNLACLATIADGIDLSGDDLKTLRGNEPQDCPADVFYDLRDDACLNEAYMGLGLTETVGDSGRPPRFTPRQPDLLGEYLIVWALKRATDGVKADPGRIARLVCDAFLLNAGAFVDFLLRLNEDFPHSAVLGALKLVKPPLWEKVDVPADAIDLVLPAYFGFLGLAQTGIESGADLEARLSNGAFPLLMSAQNGHAEIVSALIAAGADVNVVDPINGTFPLLQSAQEGHAEIVSALIAAGADVNVVNQKNGTFPLLQSAQNGHAEIVSALIAAGADVNVVDPINGTFPLLQSAQEGHAEIVSALIAAGADVNVINQKNGTFPLLQSAQEGHAEIVSALIAAGADLMMINSETGLCAADMAVMSQNAALIDLFAATLSMTKEDLVNATGRRVAENKDKLDAMVAVQQGKRIDYIQAGLAILDPWPVPNPLALDWFRPEGDALRHALAAFDTFQGNEGPPTGKPIGLRAASLRFLPGATLLEFAVAVPDQGTAALTLLDLGESFVHLDGTSPPLHAVNAREDAPTRLDTPALAVAYLNFFCLYVAIEDGSFRIVETADALTLTHAAQKEKDKLSKIIEPLEIVGNSDDAHQVKATVCYGTSVFAASFSVGRGGFVEMLDDDQLATDLSVPSYTFRDGLRRVDAPQG